MAPWKWKFEVQVRRRTSTCSELKRNGRFDQLTREKVYNVKICRVVVSYQKKKKNPGPKIISVDALYDKYFYFSTYQLTDGATYQNTININLFLQLIVDIFCLRCRWIAR